MKTIRDNSPEYKNISQTSKKIFTSLNKIKTSSQRIKSKTSLKSLFKSKHEQCADLLPGQLQCLRLQEFAHVENLFLQRKLTIISRGYVSLVGLCDENKISNYFGILVSTGMLLLYEYDTENDRVLFFRLGINVRGAIISLTNEIITLESNICILLKVKESEELTDWYNKLCEASSGTITLTKIKEDHSNEQVKFKKKTGGNIYDAFKNQLQYIKKSWKLSDSMKAITTVSWNAEQSMIPSLLGQDDPELSNPVVSDKDFAIDLNFKISSMVLMRLYFSKKSIFMQPFVKCFACLTQEMLSLTTNKRSVNVRMIDCNLGIVQNVKWGIRILCEEYKIDLQLTSKTSYEYWTLALMKTFSFYSTKSRSIDEFVTSVNIGNTKNESVEEYLSNTFSSRRYHSWTRPCNKLLSKNKHLTQSYPALDSDKGYNNENIYSFETMTNDLFKEPIFTSESRLVPKRNSSCLDHPIPILPNLNLSKSILNLCDSYHFEINTIYDEMEADYYDVEKCSTDERNSTPLPVRCKKHGIKKRLRNSYQQFAKKLTKSEICKLEKTSENYGISTSHFRSENNLQYADKNRKRNHQKICENNNESVGSGTGISNLWNSVFDIREKNFDIFKRIYPKISVIKNLDESDIECEYEEPLH